MLRAIVAGGVLFAGAVSGASGQIVEFVSKGRGDTLRGGWGQRGRDPFLATARTTRLYGASGLQREGCGAAGIYFASSAGATRRELATRFLGEPMLAPPPDFGFGGFVGVSGGSSGDASAIGRVAAASELFGQGEGSEEPGGWMAGAAGGTLAAYPAPGVAVVPTQFSRPVMRSANGVDPTDPRLYVPVLGVIGAGVLGVGVVFRARRG